MGEQMIAKEEISPVQQATKDGIITKDGLLWRDGKIIDLPEADAVARKYGFVYAEELVKAISEGYFNTMKPVG
jgi:7-keto-8-aminopelargonate synthetase-like enzyme